MIGSLDYSLSSVNDMASLVRFLGPSADRHVAMVDDGILEDFDARGSLRGFKVSEL